MKKLRIKFVRPTKGHAGDAEWHEIELPDDKRPAYIVVVKGDLCGRMGDILAIAETPAGEKLDGAPIVRLPAGSEFEVWEVEA